MASRFRGMFGRLISSDPISEPIATTVCRDRLNSDGFMDVILGEEEKVNQSAPALVQSTKIAKYEALGNAEKQQVDLPVFIEIEKDYILHSHLGDWETLYNSYTFTA